MEKELDGVVKDQEYHSETLEPERERENDYVLVIYAALECHT
jgi:hypothetical protein